jgi:beta-mannosidase
MFGESSCDLFNISSGWQMQDAGKISQSGDQISRVRFETEGWCKATVPGTILTSLVNNGTYPEPLYGENNRPDRIPEILARTPFWYRTTFVIPKDYTGKRIWLNFDGINYSAEVWVNGGKAGLIRGAFARGVFEISSLVKPGEKAALAVLISPQPHPGEPHEHTISQGMGGNGGISASDGPTFLCSMGWDWIPAIRDRNSGIWQKVFLTTSGPVLMKDPLVTSDLPLPSLDSADVTVQTTLENVSDQPQKGVLKGYIGEVFFQTAVELAPRSSSAVTLTPKIMPQLRLNKPQLWWPNGFGPQNLYSLKLSFEIDGKISDQQDIRFGIRKITYSVPDSENLTISVNGVRVFCKGGNWGMDEAMKRISRERLEAQIRMHQSANFTMIRNWVGQSTSEDFYELCDQYGIMLWDEFFQPNPSDGPNPTDLGLYLANVREKILRFRNHPCIAVWCARNEGYPPKQIEDALRKLMAELEPVRLYQPSSTAGHGVNSGGPYCWRTPREFYEFGEAFKTEIGSVSIPTLESIHGMMPERDWDTINDDWAEHDLAKGAQSGDIYPSMIESRYGKAVNLADFVRKAQLANYEAFRAMDEGRNAKLFKPCTAVLTWMSNPAQPSFVWQLYHHDLEPNASLFAAKKACEPIHLQLNEKEGRLQVINNLPATLSQALAHLEIYNLDSSLVYQRDFAVTAQASQATDLGPVDWPATLSSVHFIKLQLRESGGKLISENFYWRSLPAHLDNLQDLDKLPKAFLIAKVEHYNSEGKCFLNVALHNPGPAIALMTHLQLRRQGSKERVLPVYYSDNYVSLVPNESKVITIEAAQADFKGEAPLVVVDGWNVALAPCLVSNAPIILNLDAQVDHWPALGLHIEGTRRLSQFRINCGGDAVSGFQADTGSSGGNAYAMDEIVDVTTPMAGPASLYKSERWGECVYKLPMKPLPMGHTYTVRLHFAETRYSAAAKRLFNVDIKGSRVLTNFDIFKEAGGKCKTVVKQFNSVIPDQDGDLSISFIRGSADEPKISAIEVFDSSLPPAQ